VDNKHGQVVSIAPAAKSKKTKKRRKKRKGKTNRKKDGTVSIFWQKV
jgi:spore germination protein YaaH